MTVDNDKPNDFDRNTVILSDYDSDDNDRPASPTYRLRPLRSQDATHTDNNNSNQTEQQHNDATQPDLPSENGVAGSTSPLQQSPTSTPVTNPSQQPPINKEAASSTLHSPITLPQDLNSSEVSQESQSQSLLPQSPAIPPTSMSLTSPPFDHTQPTENNSNSITTDTDSI